jgi:hypothetical protein
MYTKREHVSNMNTINTMCFPKALITFINQNILNGRIRNSADVAILPSPGVWLNGVYPPYDEQ